MGTFNTYGNQSKQWGGSQPVWFTVRQKERSGGTLEDVDAGTLLRAGSLVSLSTTGGVAKVIETFEVAAAVSASDTTLKLKAYASHPKPVAGMVVMKSPASATATGKAASLGTPTLNETDGVYEFTITANDFGALAAGDILIKASAAGSSASIYAIPTGLTENDVWIEQGDYAATVASVFDGEIMEDRIQPIPAFVKTLLPMIKFTKGV